MADPTPAGDLTVLGSLLGTDKLILTRDGDSLVTALISTLFTSSPLTGTPTAPTPGVNNSTTRLATTAFVQANLDNAIASGAYTPTITDFVNVDASTDEAAFYIRVRDVVLVFGKVDIDPTAASQTIFKVSLPVASNLSSIDSIVGLATMGFDYSAGAHGGVNADPTNDLAVVYYLPGTADQDTVFFAFAYEVV